MSKIPRTPERPPATSPHDERYYDSRDLEQELRRTFQICHECRMCVNYCGSFPELFARVDRDIDAGRAEGAELLDDADMRVVSDECWQCKLCYIKCPYTADEDASELLDFPRLMAREKAARAKRDGVAWIDRVLGEPQLIGRLGSGPAASMSKLVHASRLLRKVQETVTGISAEFPLPPFAGQTFPAWFAKHERAARAGDAGSVVLFATCTGNYNLPGVPRAAVRVLEHLGYEVIRVDETCCGMPNLDGGDVPRFAEKVRANVAALLPHVQRGATVLVTQPTCGYTLKREWVEYVPEDDVRSVAAATVDLMEFLERVRKGKGLPAHGGEGLGTVAYHAACHLRAQKIGFPAARVLEKGLSETKVQIIQECSAVDGTWGMKADHYETGRRYAKKLTDAVDESEPDVVITDCSLSAMRIERETGKAVLHPVQALARAWGLEER
jgi:glycerol-3-phosphate dehydrogenase subunit C